jgi:hypothetical protein
MTDNLDILSEHFNPNSFSSVMKESPSSIYLTLIHQDDETKNVVRKLVQIINRPRFWLHTH